MARPRMTMIPFSPTMYPDEIRIHRSAIVDQQGHDVTAYPGEPEAPELADVWSQEINRLDARSERLTVTTAHYVTTPQNRSLKPDDHIIYVDASGAEHVLTVTGESEPIGTGDVSFITECIEVD
jgi:hypothetical protein